MSAACRLLRAGSLSLWERVGFARRGGTKTETPFFPERRKTKKLPPALRRSDDPMTFAEAQTMLNDQSTEAFLDALASGNATPGGGSAAAIMGAMGAALVSMVCNLTIGKKGYEAAEPEMRAVLAEAEALRAKLTGMVADDIAAFDWLMAAYKLPKESDADKAARSAAIQSGLKGATQVPLDCALACGEVVRLTARAVEVGNVNVISDVGVGVLAGWAALRSAALNVHINAPQIKDREFAEGKLKQLEQLLAECGPLAEQVHERVHGKLG